MALRRDDPGPPYVQIANDLREAINRGEIAPGEQLPSTTELTAEYGVAHMTVRNALRLLRDEGLVVAQQGRGVFVRSTFKPDGNTGTVDMGAVVERLDRITSELEKLTDRVDQIEKSASSRSDKRS